MFKHIFAAKRNMELRQQEYSLTKKRSSDEMMDHKSLGSSSCTDAAMFIDEENEETLEMDKKKKPRSPPWWDVPGAFNDLNSVVKELPKTKDATSSSSTNLDHESKGKKYEGSLSLIQRGKFFDDYDESHTSSNNNKTNQDPLLGSYKTKYNISHVESCFTFCSVNDLIKDTNKGNERSLSLSHHDNNVIDDLREDEMLSESSGSNNKGYRHVTLEDLGVSLEDLKNMSWEAFDQTW